MSNSNMTSEVNQILNPYLFQVIGSTPESIRDALKNSAVKGQPGSAIKLAALCVFSAAVNKATMEQFIAQPGMAEARPLVNTTFNISGKANMTGLTLLGHCLLTTKFADGITFAVEFRKKMGQNHLWEGNLESGSLSDKQKEILKEKKRVTSADSAMLLGAGFLKYSGIVNEAYTAQEATFWGERAPASNLSNPLQTGAGPNPNLARTFERVPTSPPRPRTTTTAIRMVLSNGSQVEVPEHLANYYKIVNDTDDQALANSIERRGLDAWINAYEEIASRDPGMKGAMGASVAGR